MAVPRTPNDPNAFNPPYSFVFTSKSQTIITKSCSGLVNVAFADINGMAAKFPASTELSLSGNNLKFFSDENCTAAISKIVIPTNVTGASFFVKSDKSGDFIITASEKSVGENYQNFSTAVGPAFKLVLLNNPTSTVAGFKLDSLTLEVHDAYENIISSSIPVIVTTSPNSSSLTGTLTVNSNAGIVGFNDLKISTSGNFSLTFSSPSILSATTSSFTVSGATATKLILASTPAAGVINTNLPTLTYSTYDQYNNQVSQSGILTLTAYSDSNCSFQKTGALSSSGGSFSSGATWIIATSVNYIGMLYLRATAGQLKSDCTTPISIYPKLGLFKSSTDLNAGTSKSISGLIVGGEAPFTYKSISTIGTIVDANGLVTAGTYSGSVKQIDSVIVTDSLGQVQTVSVSIYPAIKITNSSLSIVAGKNQQISAAGGLPPYNYSAPGALIDTNGNLMAPANSGTQSVTVTDATGASKSINFTITAPLSVNPQGRVAINLGASQSLVAAGGLAPYSYSMANGSGSVNSSGVFSSSSMGINNVLVRDSAGSSVTVQINVTTGGVTNLVVTQSPTSTFYGKNFTPSFKVEARNDTSDIDYSAIDFPATVELMDASCSNVITGSDVIISSNKFEDGVFSPSFLTVKNIGSYKLRLTLGAGGKGPVSVCTNTFAVLYPSLLLSSANNQTCATKNSSAFCWGNNDSGQVGVDPNIYPYSVSPVKNQNASSVSEIVMGGEHSCLLSANILECFGLNSMNQLGQGSSANSSFIPLQTGGTVNYGLAAGLNHTCGYIDGVFSCWGDDTYHQLGRGKVITSGLSCSNVSSLGQSCSNLGCKLVDSCNSLTIQSDCQAAGCSFNAEIVMCSGSAPNSCQGSSVYTCESIASSTDCSAVSSCQWDSNSCLTKNSNFSSSGNRVSSVMGLTGYVSESSLKYNTSLAIISGDIYCWGYNESSVCGVANKNIFTPIKNPALTISAIDVSLGKDHACAVTSSGFVSCWGANDAGQLGRGSISPIPIAANQDLTTISGIKAVKSGDKFSCALTLTGQVYCWGANNIGQLGQGATSLYISSPQLVSGVSNIAELTVSGSHACAATAINTVKCWGSNTYGEIAQPLTLQYSATPVSVSSF